MKKFFQYLWGGATLTAPLWASPLQSVISHHAVIFSAIGSALAFATHLLAGLEQPATEGNGAGK